METISTRIMQVVEANGGNKSEFARRLNVTPAYISKLCKNANSAPSDRTISDICHEFNVNELWLRTGEGEMFVKLNRNQEISSFLGDILKGDPDFRARLITALSRLTPEQWKQLEGIADTLIAEMQKKETDQ